jgi:hypothetical protein
VIVLWIYLAGVATTLVLFRAAAATRGTQVPSPPKHVVWARQVGFAAGWPLFWFMLAGVSVFPPFRRWVFDEDPTS